MPTARLQPSFAAGVLGPGLRGRVDIAKYDVGLAEGVNVFVHAHGGLSNRAGFEFITEVMDSSKLHRLLPFRRDDDDNAVILMGDELMKVVIDGAVVQDGGGDYSLATPYTSAQLSSLDYVQSVDVILTAQGGVFPQRLSRTSWTSWTWADVEIDPTISAPSGGSGSSANSGSETYRYKVATVADGVESFPTSAITVSSAQSLTVSGAKNTITWSSEAGADEYNVYRDRNGVYGYVGFTEGTSFVDDNIAPDLTQTPKEPSGIWASVSDYPTVVALFQQRAIYAGSQSEPETVRASRTGDFENFTRSRILRADDRAETVLTGESLNTVRAILPLRELLVFTSFSEFSLIGPNGDYPADNVVQKQFGYSGSVANVKPLVIEDTALFVDRTGRNVRDLRYAFEQDGYSGNDLTIFASHFFEGKAIVGWAFAKNPHSIVWVHLDDGTLLSFTYKREHQVWAWTEHDLGGEVESAAVIPEGNYDALYVIVKRTIDGQTKRYVERLRDRYFTDVEDCFFVDSGLTYSGAPATTISGLDHLEGETVVALADGSVVEGLVVASGSVTLPTAASKVHVGLPMLSEGETLPPAVELQSVGSARGRWHKVSKMRMQVEKTRGVEVAGAEGRFAEMVTRSGDLAALPPLETGMVDVTLYADWNRQGSMRFRQRYPLPMTILGLSPELSIGRQD